MNLKPAAPGDPPGHHPKVAETTPCSQARCPWLSPTSRRPGGGGHLLQRCRPGRRCGAPNHCRGGSSSAHRPGAVRLRLAASWCESKQCSLFTVQHAPAAPGGSPTADCLGRPSCWRLVQALQGHSQPEDEARGPADGAPRPGIAQPRSSRAITTSWSSHPALLPEQQQGTMPRQGPTQHGI